jgi:hypothetical protein
MESMYGARASAIGAGLSFACVIHCMAMPVLIALAPFAGLELWLDGGFERALWGISVGLSLASLCWGYRVHRRANAFVPLVFALSILAVAEIAKDPWHAGFVAVAAVLLAASQRLNHRLCRTCRDCNDH